MWYDRAMPKLAIIIGSALILVGLIGYFAFGGDNPHWTALIPAIIGLLIEMFGAMALVVPAMRKHLMHGALLFAVLGMLGTASSLLKVPQLLSDASQLPRPAATSAQAITFVLCAVFVVAGVMSFVAARRNKTA